ncbi:hypothetical protein SAMN05216416_0817 [Streptococcus equinus]|uniref:hypothetical protein n=1 Tax=Streptococcus lutetiensis TaxID=150055 RepID=UPI0008E60574|nr:hypothetical protein [Streptococcus lutetiensis]SFR70083.1 hypothetical protein SAMN05216416_0817 [Streptococcus equinus]
MDKKLSKLELVKMEIEVAERKTNQKIKELGMQDQSLYTALTTIQNLFNNIRNVPEESKLKYEKLKEIQVRWKQQADKIEAEFKNMEMKAVSMTAVGVGAGVTVAAMGPTAAMGVATTFGVASTGTAISSLSGAAATNAALAWLGGGALTVGGGGMAAGESLLLLAGPIGWGIAGISALTTLGVFFKGREDKKRLENIYTLIGERDVKSYKLAVVELSERIARIQDESSKLINAISKIATFGTDYTMMTEEQQYELGAYVNLMEASTMLLVNPILGLQSKYTQHDFEQLCEDGCKSLIFVDLYLEKEIDYEVVRKYYKEHEQLVMALANMLYKVPLDDKDRKLLIKSLKKDNGFLSSVNMSKHDLSISDLVLIDKALEYQYKASRN